MPQKIKRDCRPLLQGALSQNAHGIRLDQPLREEVGQDLRHEVFFEEGVVLRNGIELARNRQHQ